MKKILFIGHSVYNKDGSFYDTNNSVTYEFLEHYFKGQYSSIRHSLYKNGESCYYPDGVNNKSISLPLIGKLIDPLRYILEIIINFIFILVLRPKVILALDPLSGLSPVIMKKLGLVKKVIFITPDFSEKRFENKLINRIYFDIDKFVTKNCDYNLCNSIYVIKHKQNLYLDIDKNKYFHMPNIPNPWIIDEIKSKKLKKIKNSIIYVGAISSQIDFVNLFKSLYESNNQNYELVFVGDGDKKNDLEDYVLKNNLKDKIKFLGQLPFREVLEEIAKSEIGIALYNGTLSYDKFRDSCKIREYQALSCIPITTDVVKANVEEIKNLNNGIIIDSSNLSDGINKLLNNNEYKKEIISNIENNEDLYNKKFIEYKNLL